MQTFKAINIAFTKRIIKLELAVDNFEHCLVHNEIFSDSVCTDSGLWY